MTVHEILLGFEVGTGKPVYISLHHLGAFGMTQLSGKTTLLEACISRSGLKGLAFITKRGEKGFTSYTSIPPYYKERVDWRYVESLVNTALGEKVKYEPGMRSAIMKVSRGPRSLREVQDLAKKKLAKAKRAFMKDVYERLIAYLDLVLPGLEKRKFADRVELKPGVNVMDLSDMRLEVQQLVIGSSIDYVFNKLNDVVVIIPEAWEMLPQFRMTPVKFIAERFIRKGAAVNNYLWIDSQDIGGIDKTPLRQVSIWLMGRMMEAHEVARILKQLLGLKVPAKEIQTLQLGHFFATIGDEVKKVYVLPVDVPEDVGRAVAKGTLPPEYVRDEFLVSKLKEDEELWREKFEEEKRVSEGLQSEVNKLLKKNVELAREIRDLETDRKRQTERIQQLELKNKALKEKIPNVNENLREECAHLKQELEKVHEALKIQTEISVEHRKKAEDYDKLTKILKEITYGPSGRKPTYLAPGEEPPEILVAKEQASITVVADIERITLRQTDLDGRIAIVYAEGLLPEKAFTLKHLNKIMESRFGRQEFPGNLPKVLNKFVAWGYLEKVQAGKRWDYRVKLTTDEAKEKGLLKEAKGAVA